MPDPERIDLGPLDDHRDAAQRAVAALAGGGLVGLAVGGSTALLAPATVPAALRLLDGSRPSAAGPGPALLLPDPAALLDWAEPRPEAARRLAARVWPGPVRLSCAPTADGLWRHLPAEARALLLDGDGRATFQVPDEPVVRSILGLMAGPTLLIEAGPDDRAASALFDRAALVIAEAPPAEARRATIVRLDDDGWAVARPGVVAESTLQELAGTILLFVCTGNTCRSPMAAAHCRLLLARHLGCAVADLPARGFTVESAGVGAADGAPASTHAVAILRRASVEAGLDPSDAGLGRHRSRPVTAHLVRRADQILAMTWDHLDALLDYFPEAADRVRLLDPAGLDIPDPYGSTEEVYHETSGFILRGLRDVLAPILGDRPGPDAPPA